MAINNNGVYQEPRETKITEQQRLRLEKEDYIREQDEKYLAEQRKKGWHHGTGTVRDA